MIHEQKVKLKISRSELNGLAWLMANYVLKDNEGCRDLQTLVKYANIYSVAEKVRKKLMKSQAKHSLTMTIQEGYTLYIELTTIYDQCDQTYEKTVADQLRSEILKQLLDHSLKFNTWQKTSEHTSLLAIS